MGVIRKQSIKGTIVNYIGTVIGMFTVLFILTNYLTQEEVGLTQVFVAAGFLFAGLAQIGTNASIVRFYPYFKNPDKNDHGFFFFTLIVPLIGFCIYLFVFLIFKNLITSFFIQESELFVNYFYFIIPLGFFMLYQTVFETNSVVLHRIVVPVFVKEVGVRCMSLGLYLLFAFHFISITGLIIGFCCTYGIAALINFCYLFSLRRISLKPDLKHITKPLRKDFLFYTLFLMGSALTTVIVPNLGTFFITAKLGLALAGVYAISKHVTALIEIPYRSLGAIANPHVSQTIKENDFVKTNRLIKKVSMHQFLVGVAIFFLVWTNIDLIFQLIPNGKDYISGKWVIFILGISTIINSSLSIGAATLSFSKYYYYSLFLTFVLTGTAIAMNLFCVPIFGINGAALATLSSFCIYHLFLQSLIYWKLKVIPISWNHFKILVIILVLLGLDYLYKQFATSLIMQNFEFNLLILCAEALLRTTILGGIGFYCVYFYKISDEVNDITRELLTKIKGYSPK